MAESYWNGEFDEVDLEEEAFFDLIEEILGNLGFMIVEKDWDEGKIVMGLKSSYVDSVGSLTFRKNQKHVSIRISHEIIKPDVKKFPLDEKIFEVEKIKLEDSWENLCRMIDSLFSSGFIPAPEMVNVCCPYCGREIDWDSLFCKYCGHEIK